MKNFSERVESLLIVKSANELKAFVRKIASKIPEMMQEEFLVLLENKRVVISKSNNGGAFSVEGILERISELLENVEEYDIEAYYYDNWDDEGYQIESDDGFCAEFYACYSGAVSLLECGYYEAAAKAFSMLSETIERFDAYNENNDCAIYVETFIDEGELYIELGNVETETIVSVAEEGLKNTAVKVKKRHDLATLLARFAKEAGNQDAYRYAITERFYSSTGLENYLPILDLGEHNTKETAIQYMDRAIKPVRSNYPSKSDRDYYAIHFLNSDYDLVFDAVSSDKKPLGWSTSIKGMVVPLFVGLLAGFDEQAVIIQKTIARVLGYENTDLLFKCFRDTIGTFTEEQEKNWHTWCVSEVKKRTDAIVSEKHRGSYGKAACLLVAIAEMRRYRGEKAPHGIVNEYVEKYPRHSAFRGELRSAAAMAKLTGIKI